MHSSQENINADLRPATLLKKILRNKFLPQDCAKFLRTPFHRTPLDDCFCLKLINIISGDIFRTLRNIFLRPICENSWWFLAVNFFRKQTLSWESPKYASVVTCDSKQLNIISNICFLLKSINRIDWTERLVRYISVTRRRYISYYISHKSIHNSQLSYLYIYISQIFTSWYRKLKSLVKLLIKTVHQEIMEFR